MSAVFVVFFFCLHQGGEDYKQQHEYRNSCDEKLKEDRKVGGYEIEPQNQF